MFNIELYAGDTFTYSQNVALTNTQTWSANGLLTTLDLLDIFNGNTPIGTLAANLSPINSNLPNTINYTLTLTANSSQTAQWIANSVNILERRLYLFTKYTSNTGNIVHGNSSLVIVKAALDS